jgi:hypothetical protein
LEILADLKDFWNWLHGSLSKYVKVHPDFNHILCKGESAGGWLAIQSAIVQPEDNIKAIIAAYPCMDVNDKKYCTPGETVFGAPMIPQNVLSDHLKGIKPGDVVSEAYPPERMPLCLSAVQQGLLKDLIGQDERLDVIWLLQKAQKLPFVFIYNGSEDSAVPAYIAERFADVFTQRFGADQIELFIGPGEHGFDYEVTLETPWLKKGLEKVTREWLS